ncbi:556_t:CDS:1, partial [Ambispora leptoticha]
NGIGVTRDLQQANYWYRKERSVKINKTLYMDIDDNSGLEKILNDEKYQLSWIPYNEFRDIEKIGNGGFATVYFAHWFDKTTNVWMPFALKLIHDSNKYNQEFADEVVY